MPSSVQRRPRAYLAAGALLLLGRTACAQPAAAPDAALDPTSPLEPMADIGVDWPDLSRPDEAEPAGAATVATPEAGQARRYTWVIRGLGEEEAERIRTRFAQASTLATGEGKPANVAQIDRRARGDETLLTDILRAEGFYDARVEAGVARETGGSRIAVTLDVEPGPRYRFTSVELPGLAAAGDKADVLRRSFPIAAQDPVDADKVTAAQSSLRTALGREGFAFARVEDPRIVVDHDTATATLVLPVDPGGGRSFGTIRAEGDDPLFGARHLGRIARFKPGDPYDSALIEDFRRALIQTGLVSTVRITPTPDPVDPRRVDIVVRLERAPPRTVAGELGYGTGEGVRSEVSWTHRNLIPPEGQVTFRGVLGTREQSLSASLRRNNYKARDRVLTAQIAAAHTNLDAYDARTFALTGTLERQTNIIWQKKWTWSVGGELVASDERDTIRATGEPRRRTFFIVAAPASLAYDGTDDLLNPSTGHRLGIRVSPEASLQNGTFTYLRTQIDGSIYRPVSGGVVLAARFRLGSITGASRDRIAPSRRFYAGGGSSVRGFGYQDIGPDDANGDPVGGKSLVEIGSEARFRFGNFGIVPFLDAGNLYTSTLPKFTGLRIGTGIGARYYTSFGPIRLDVGTPLDRRPGEARVAVYVSLGQAF